MGGEGWHFHVYIFVIFLLNPRTKLAKLSDVAVWVLEMFSCLFLIVGVHPEGHLGERGHL